MAITWFSVREWVIPNGDVYYSQTIAIFWLAKLVVKYFQP